MEKTNRDLFEGGVKSNAALSGQKKSIVVERNVPPVLVSFKCLASSIYLVRTSVSLSLIVIQALSINHTISRRFSCASL